MEAGNKFAAHFQKQAKEKGANDKHNHGCQQS
jgi:hypothetical protein